MSAKSKLGRPPLPEGSSREARLFCRLLPSEVAQIEAAAKSAKKSKSQWIRETLSQGHARAQTGNEESNGRLIVRQCGISPCSPCCNSANSLTVNTGQTPANLKPVHLSQSLSLVPFRVRVLFNETELSTGTAFTYLLDGVHYLVTNWHIVTGRSPSDHQPISKTGGIPNRLVLYLPVDKGGFENQRLCGWSEFQIDLYEDTKDLKTPMWWEHPHHNSAVDLVVMEIKGLEKCKVVPANDVSLGLDNFLVWTGMDVFVIGYPKGISGGGGLPIWKRGSIASEPEIDIDRVPMFYIDTATRPGTSGSPVFAQASGMWPVEGRPFPAEAILGTGYRFLGIYSGRVRSHQSSKVTRDKEAAKADRLEQEIYEAQLGKVWKEKAIVETIRAKTVGISSWEVELKGVEPEVCPEA